MTIRYTPRHNLPYPEGSDSVAPASRDFRDLAINADAAMTELVAAAAASAPAAARTTVQLTNSQNMDTVTTAGLYSVWSASPANQPANWPVTSLGVAEVVTFGAVTVQTVRSTLGTVHQRSLFSAGWGEWKRLDAGAVSSGDVGQESVTALKTAPVALSASTSIQTETVATGGVRFPFNVAAPIARWRLHIRNYNDRMGTAYNSGASFTGLWVGQHASNGAFAAAPTQVSGPFTLPSDGSEVVTPWSSAPLGDGTDMLLSLGWTGATGPNTQSPAGAYRSTSSTTGGQTSGAGYTKTGWVPFSWWIEVQTPATTPIVAMWGDSIAAGTGNDLVLHDSPLSQYARRIGAIPVHYAYPGTGMVAWTDGNSHQWSRWADLSRVDAVLHFMGQNDLGSATTLAQMQARFNDTIGHLKANVSPNVYLATITPHAGKTEAQRAVRRAYNTWLRTLPGGALDVFDYSAAVGNAGDTALQPAFDSGDGLHLSTAGSAAAAAATVRPVASPGTARDTGWRRLTTPTGASGNVFMRRQADVVHLMLHNVASAAGGHANVAPITAGFVPMSFTGANWRNGTVVDDAGTSTRVASFFGSNMRILNAEAGKAYGGYLTWLTSDPWPTTLPGAAV